MNELLNFYKGKKIFLTGHTGFKGTWLSRILILAGAEVTGYSLEPPTNPNLFEQTETARQMKSIIGDIRNGEKLKAAVLEAKPEILFHLAAQPIVRTSYKDPVGTYESNVMGTVNILEAVRACDTVKSFVNITTDKVYLNKEWAWGYRENEELCGYDPYSNSKSCSELVTHSYKNSFFSDQRLAISTARAGNVIGGGDFSEDRIIPDCIRAAIQKEDIVVRNPKSIRPYQHVFEALLGYLLIAEKQYDDKDFEGSYNIGPNEEGCVTTGNLVETFCDSWENMKWTSNIEDTHFYESNLLKLDCSKIKNKLGWKPKLSIKEAVDLTIEWTKCYYLNDNLNELTENQINRYFRV